MLPTINHPIFVLELPLSKTKVRYRPILVKEEKMLLIAKESGEYDDIIENVKAVISNCVLDKLDFNTTSLVEVEYLFLHLRSKSIGEVIRLKVVDEFDKKIKHDVEFSIDEIEIIQNPKNNKNIKLDEKLGLIMSYPSFNTLKKSNFAGESSDFYTSLMNSIDSVYDADTVYKFSDATEAERVAFIDSLSTQHLEKIKDFFITLPRMHKKIEYINSRGGQSELVLESFYDFF